MEWFALFPLFFIPLFFLLFVVNIIGLVFWVWMIIDCASNETDKNDQRLIWILIIVFTSWIGALIYYFVRRPERIKKLKK